LLEIADLAVDYPELRCRYDLVVPKGALCAVVGPSGGGKTTLINAIAGFGRKPQGVIRFDGRDLNPLGPAERPLSILFQEHNLFPHLTAAQNVGLGVNPGLRLDTTQHKAVLRALEQVGLEGYDRRRPAELSGGQRQRVALARALVRDRPLMLLDEPFSGLDRDLRRDMIALVDELRRARNLTVLMSIHTPEDVLGKAELMALIEEGRVMALDTPEKVLARS